MDLMDLILARAPLDDSAKGAKRQQVQLLHLRGFHDSATPEIRQVLDESTGIKYTISMQSGECTKQGLNSRTESMLVSFPHSGGSLLIDEFVETILERSDDYVLMKKWNSPVSVGFSLSKLISLFFASTQQY